MNKLILSAFLMLSSITFSQDAQEIIDVVYTSALEGEKSKAIEWYEAYSPLILLPVFDTSGCVTYKQNKVKYSFCDEGVTVLFEDSVLLDKMLTIADSVFGKSEVEFDEETGLITFIYDYVQFVDGEFCPAYIDAGIVYYMFIPWLKEED